MKTQKLLQSVIRNVYLFAISLFLFNKTSYCQTQSVITQSTLSPSQLTSDQLAKFNKLSASTLHDNFQLAVVQNLATSQINNKVRLALPTLPCPELIFTATKIEYTSENDYYWYGIIDSDEDAACKGGSIILMAKGGEKFGTIIFDDYSYEFQDLGNGIQALSRFKLEALAENDCNVGSAGGSRINSQNQTILPSTNRIIPCQSNCEVRILVLYTQAAQDIEANIDNRIALAIAQTNQAYQNSDVNPSSVRLVLAGSQKVNFTESNPPNINNDVNALASTASIQALRNNFQADIVMLLANANYGPSGAVPAPGPNFNDAYGIVKTNVATGGYYTFAHEVGHVFGALHDITSGGTIEHGYTFSTGFIFTKQRYTILAVNPVGSTRELNYSNPDVSIKNKATGTTNYNNNAQQHRNTGCTVANFFSYDLSINILQDNPNVCCTSVTAEAEVVCGTAPFYFNWKISYDGINWQVMPNSEIVTFNTDCDKTTLIIELTVTDATGQSRTTTKNYNADCGQTTRTVKNTKKSENEKLISNTIERIFPNPARSTTQVDLNLVNTDNLKIDLVDASGNVRRQVVNANFQKGRKTINIDTDGLRSGFYKLRVISKNKIEYHSFVVIK